MEIINLTPHPVVVYDDQDERVLDTFPPSGTVARLKEDIEPGKTIDGYQTTTVTLGGVAGLPDEKEGVIYIVSMPLIMGLRAAGVDRQDVVYPFGQVRDGDGRIIGCRTFGSLPPTGGRDVAEAPDEAPDEEVTDRVAQDARVLLIWAAAVAARRGNLSLAMANVARAVALEICQWSVTEEVTDGDLQGAWTVISEMIWRARGDRQSP